MRRIPHLRWTRPISRTLSDQVSEEILNRIARGDILPGQSLPPQRWLAEELGVGMSVIREAIQRLQVLQVVRTRHGSGTVVEQLRWNQIALQPALHVLAVEEHLQVQIAEARYAIERETILLATRRATRESLKVIFDVIDAASPPPESFVENMKSNARFHLAVAAASQNAVLVDMLQPLLEIGFSTIPEIFDGESAELAWRSHRLIYKAIAAGDEDGAIKALEFHRNTGKLEVDKAKVFLKNSRLKLAPLPKKQRSLARATNP
jgi:DNA-binding FadR family transcriptional regulator